MAQYRLQGPMPLEVEYLRMWYAAVSHFEHMVFRAVRNLAGLDTAWGNRLWNEACAVRDGNRLDVGERVTLTRPDGKTISIERIE